ncbi:MAG: Mrp/NBP35 family ATP-binding protein [Maricaulaceae bacterium]
MSYSETEALKALQSVVDPKTGKDIISAGLLADLQFSDGRLRVILLIDATMAEAYRVVQNEMEAALSKIGAVQSVSVLMTAHKAGPNMGSAKLASSQPPRSKGNPHKARRPEGYQGDAHIRSLIAVSSAKGGVGKSTVAANVAVALAKAGQKVGLLDADIHGPSAPILFGLRGEMANTHKREGRMMIVPKEAFGIKLMSIGFLTKDDGPVVWRGPMVQGAISKMLWDVDWGELDVLIIDMPPGTGDAQLGLAQDVKPNGAIIVSTPQDLALSDARKGVGMFQKVNIPVIGLVENMSIYTCPDCGSSHAIFGHGGAEEEAKTMETEFLGATPLLMDIRQSGDAGHPISASGDAAGQAFHDIAERVLPFIKAVEKRA